MNKKQNIKKEDLEAGVDKEELGVFKKDGTGKIKYLEGVWQSDKYAAAMEDLYLQYNKKDTLEILEIFAKLMQDRAVGVDACDDMRWESLWCCSYILKERGYTTFVSVLENYETLRRDNFELNKQNEKNKEREIYNSFNLTTTYNVMRRLFQIQPHIQKRNLTSMQNALVQILNERGQNDFVKLMQDLDNTGIELFSRN